MTVLRPKSEVSSSYVAFRVQAPDVRASWSAAAAGTNINNLTVGDLSGTPVPLPPRAEQERIVARIEEHLSRLDGAISATRRVMHRARSLVGHLIETSMAGVGPFTSLDQFAAERGITDGPFGSKLKSSHYTDQGPRVIRLENVGHGDFIDVETHISAAYFEDLRRHEVKGGDLIVASLVADRVRACAVPATVGPAIVKADCIRVRPRDGVDVRFLNYALMRPSLGNFVAERISGVGRSRLGLGNVRAIPVPDASPKQQRAIADRLDQQLTSVDVVAAHAERAIRVAEGLRRSILAAAFSGKLVPQDPSDEPASTLLARIRAGRLPVAPTARRRAIEANT